MAKPFPVRESGILSASELVSRLLGLLFLARFVNTLGLEVSAAFRIALPLIGVAAAFGTIGLPQALTRLFAVGSQANLHDRRQANHHANHDANHDANRQANRQANHDANRDPNHHAVPVAISRSDLLTSLYATICAAWFTVLALFVLASFAASERLDRQELSHLLLFTMPLLLLMCVTGSLRGMLYGLRSTYSPAIAQVLEVSTRVFVLVTLVPLVASELRFTGAEFGILTMTVGEAVAGLFLGTVLFLLVRRRGLVRDDWQGSDGGFRQLRRLVTVLRMSLAPTGQSLLASLGYALELPLAQVWLSQRVDTQTAEQWIAEYAAIALPLLCAPMVLTDGMATALLPLAANDKARGETGSFAIHLRRAIGAVAMVALPTTGALFVFAPTLTAWFGAPSATAMLLLLLPFTLPLYVQAPLASLLQAQGYSRALLLAGLCGDAARIGGLWLGTVHWQMGRDGLALGFACSVLMQTGVLLGMATRLLPEKKTGLR